VRSHYTCAALPFRNSTFAAGRTSPWVSDAEDLAFRDQPLVGDLPAQRGTPARPFHEWIGTAERYGEPATGTLRSPAFEVTHDQIAFRMGGSDSPDVYARLVVDGREQHRAWPRGGENLRTTRWNVARLQGRTAIIELIDRSSTGHLNVEGLCYSR
jgi:hypothetical protein